MVLLVINMPIVVYKSKISILIKSVILYECVNHAHT